MGILQARILEWVAMPSSRGSSRPSTLTRYQSVFSLHLFPDIALVPNAGPSGSWWEVVWALPFIPFLNFPSLRSNVLERLSNLFYFSVAKLPTSYIMTVLSPSGASFHSSLLRTCSFCLSWCSCNLFIYWPCWVFVAAQTFFSCSEQELLSRCGVQAFHCSGVSCQGPMDHRLWSAWASVAVARVALRHVGS